MTLVAFGGIRGGVGIPPYEFFRVTDDLPVRRIFVRDLDQVWYLQGIRGLGGTLPEAASALREMIVPSARVVTTGNSAGGFAAIAFGALLGADEVHAFSPQTALDRRHRLMWLDLRWWRQMGGVRRLDVDPDLLDLRRFLDRHAARAVHVHHSADHGRDRRHAKHLAGVRGVTLHPHEGGGHRLVAELRDRGDLDRILTEAIAHPDV